MDYKKIATKEQLDAAFGSDRALGVTFQLETENGFEEVIDLDQFLEMCKQLGDDMPGTVSLLPHGGSAVCCTDYASLIFLRLPGRVQIFGFANVDNPSSRCAREEFHPEGHDFAVVDGRFIVDPWPRLVPMVMDQAVFDLFDPADAALALDVYGPRECWKHVVGAERYAKTSARHLDDAVTVAV